MEPIKVIIAEDHAILRRSIRQVLEIVPREIAVIAEAENGKDLIGKLNLYDPDIILTDIQMPVMDGIEATRIIKEKYPKISVICLSTFNSSLIVKDTIAAGAKGYLLKSDVDKDELANAIREVYEGKCYFGRGVKR